MLDKLARRVVKPKFTFSRLGQLFFTIREIFKLLFRVRPKLLVLVFVLNALWGFSTIPGFYLEKLILDRIVSSLRITDINVVLYSIGFLIALRLILELIRNLLSNFIHLLRRMLSRIFTSELEIMMAHKLTQLDLSTIEDPDFKNKFNKIERDVGSRAWGIVMPFSDIPNYFIGFISSVGLIVFLNPFVAGVVLVVSIPQFWVNSRYIKKDYELDNEFAPKYTLWGWLTYYLIRNRNFMELKLLGLSDFLSKKLFTVQTEVLRKRMELEKKRALSNIWGYLPLSIYEFGVSVWLVFLVMMRKVTVGSFVMYLSALRSAETNLGGLVSSFLEVYENYIYVVDLVWFLNLESKIGHDSGKIKVSGDNFAVEFRDVWFRYKEDQPWIIKGVSFKIDPHEKLALVGVNGAGKSTLIKLLARFYDPEKGEILVNGINLPEIDLTHWREKLAVLFQEFESYPFSVRDTVGYGDIERIDSIDEIREAVEKTEMEEFVESLPLKYENPLDPDFEKGVKPSIGQRQRLGISRIIFRKNAGVVIMDEPTSSVDPEAEEKIFQELVGICKRKTLIFVTQRFSTVRIADRVMVLKKGRIVEEGTHKDLMRFGGEYAKLFKLQAKGYQ